MKKAMVFACVIGLGFFISSCKGNFGDIFGTSDDGHHCNRDSTGHHGHHDWNDHDADDTVIVVDTAVLNHSILQSH